MGVPRVAIDDPVVAMDDPEVAMGVLVGWS